MATDMLTSIESAMKTTIEAMVVGPYFHTWGTVNEPDMAKQDFPSAEIILVQEESLHEVGSAHAGAYTNRAHYEIIVKARLPVESSAGLQVYDIHKELNEALSDLKKCFGINYYLDGCHMIRYQGAEREFEPQGDILVPKRMITSWTVDYSQDRADPTTGADA